MASSTKKCSIQDFQPDIQRRLQQYLSSDEKEIACYETKIEIGTGLFRSGHICSEFKK